MSSRLNPGWSLDSAQKMAPQSVAELVSGCSAKIHHTEVTRGSRPLSVIPWTEDKEDLMLRVVRFECRVLGLRAPHIFLIPPASHLQSRYGYPGEVRLNSS